VRSACARWQRGRMIKKEKVKQVLFLDMDGVLNSAAFFLGRKKPKVPMGNRTPMQQFKYDLCPTLVGLLNYVLNSAPDVRIVISSAWGHYYSIPQFRAGLKSKGLSKENAEKIIGITPRKMSSMRCNEVVWWIQDHKEETGVDIKEWLTIDDHVIFPLKSQDSHYGKYKDQEIQTNSEMGLTMTEVRKILTYFNPKFKVPEVLL
jgi:hypothetical protein